MDWLYVWSPRYRFFHEFLFSAIHDLSGFSVNPIFAEQHLFKPVKTSSCHFLGGISIKIHVIVNYIQKNMGKFFFFTDVDLIVFSDFSMRDLTPYFKYDITAMKECSDNLIYNIGCLLIRCTPETLAFFTKIRQRIITEKLLDQDVFNEEIHSFSGPVGLFEPSQFLQSNMLSEDSSQYKIIQCLCSESDPCEVLIEKVMTIASCYDISAIVHFLPEDVQTALKNKEQDESVAKNDHERLEE
jgi:hypothetical protein